MRDCASESEAPRTFSLPRWVYNAESLACCRFSIVHTRYTAQDRTGQDRTAEEEEEKEEETILSLSPTHLVPCPSVLFLTEERRQTTTASSLSSLMTSMDDGSYLVCVWCCVRVVLSHAIGAVWTRRLVISRATDRTKSSRMSLIIARLQVVLLNRPTYVVRAIMPSPQLVSLCFYSNI
jgi:hypothetical protein